MPAVMLDTEPACHGDWLQNGLRARRLSRASDMRENVGVGGRVAACLQHGQAIAAIS